MSGAADRRFVYGITFFAVASCALLLIFALHRLVIAERDLSSGFGENLLWALSQVHYEEHRLIVEAEGWNRSDKSEIHAEALRLQLDLAFSRLAVLSQGSLGQGLARFKGGDLIERYTAKLATFEEEVSAAITSRIPLRRESLNDLMEQASAFRAIANDVVVAERESLGSQRNQYTRILLEAIVAVLLIIGFGTVVVLRLAASLRAAAHAEDALRRDRDFSRLLLESSGDGVLAIDRDFRCTHWNPALGTMFPLPAGTQVVGHLLADVYRLPADHIIMNMMRETLAGRSLHMAPHLLPNGNRYVEKFTHPIVSEGAIVGGVLFIRDVTDGHLAKLEVVRHRDQLETIVKERTQDLEESLLRETALRELYKGFVSMVSHQFRTPLSIIDASAQRMMRRGGEMGEKEIGERAGKIRAAVLRLTRLVASTLNAAKIDAGQIDLAVRKCDLSKLIVEVCERQKETAPDREFRVELDRLPSLVSCDPLLIDQVVANLLSNAVKYSAASHPIDVAAETDGDWIKVRVCDRGVGIPENERSQLFERFFRATTAAGVEGTGIGLHVARTLARMHGGDVQAFPRPGGGSSFVLSLPRVGAMAA